jgi:hypothetical protein
MLPFITNKRKYEKEEEKMKKTILILIIVLLIMSFAVTAYAYPNAGAVPSDGLSYYIQWNSSGYPADCFMVKSNAPLKVVGQKLYNYGSIAVNTKFYDWNSNNGSYWNLFNSYTISANGGSQNISSYFYGFSVGGSTLVYCNYDYNNGTLLDNYPTFDPNWGINYNPLLKYWVLFKEVSGGKTYWNLMFTQFQDLKITGNQIKFTGLGLMYRCENNASVWDVYQQYPTGSFIDGTIDTTIQTPKRSNHDIWDYTYTSIYFAKTDSVPSTGNTGNPIQPIPKPVFHAPDWTWTWDSSDPFGSIGSFLTSIVVYLRDLLIATMDYLGDLLKYVFMNSSSSGIDFTPLIVSVSNLTTKFPFSIPWDVKNAITSLQATPTPPSWTINFDSRYFKGGGNVVLDFSQFETLAAVSRWGILIMFNISLILLSKKLIGT